MADRNFLVSEGIKFPNGTVMTGTGTALLGQAEIPFGGGAATASVGAAAPVGAGEGDFWYDTEDGVLSIAMVVEGTLAWIGV
jgi:hypothetical protein